MERQIVENLNNDILEIKEHIKNQRDEILFLRRLIITSIICLTLIILTLFICVFNYQEEGKKEETIIKKEEGVK